MNHDWLSYAHVFRLPEYKCQIFERFDDLGNGLVRYEFYDDNKMIVNLSIRFNVDFETAQVTLLVIAPSHRNLGIGKRIAYGLYDFAIECGWVNKQILIKNSFAENAPVNGSEPFATAIAGDEVDLTDKNTLYMQWREQYAQEMGFTNP